MSMSWRSIAVFILILIAAESRAGEQSAEPSPYKLLRYEEDYTYLRDPARRTEVWDAVKYIPLAETGNSFLSLGGEARLTYGYFKNFRWGQGPQDTNGYFLQRYLLHADLRAENRLRLFGQLQSGVESGRKGGPRPTDEDGLDLHQAFVDVVVAVPGTHASLTLRAGRQELAYGSSRLVSVRDSPNVRRSFDGLRVLATAGRWRVDGFGVRPIETNRGTFDNRAETSRTFWGIYAVGPQALLPGGNVDIYYLGLDRADALFDQGAADEERHSMGIRLWGDYAGWDYNFEFVYQRGRFGNGRIRAWTAASDTGYTLRPLPLTPRLGLKADIASGDRSPDDRDLETFNALFPRGSYFGEAAVIGPANFIDLRPSVTVAITERVSLTVEYGAFWRQSTRDGIYSPALVVLRTGRASSARFIGSQVLAETEWGIDRHTSVMLHYTHFFPGRFLKETPPGKEADYFMASATYTF